MKEALDYALSDVGMDVSDIDGSVGAYFSEHFQRQLLGTAMVHDYLGLNPKPHKRVEGGGATGGAWPSRQLTRRWPLAGWTSAWSSASRTCPT